MLTDFHKRTARALVLSRSQISGSHDTQARLYFECWEKNLNVATHGKL